MRFAIQGGTSIVFSRRENPQVSKTSSILLDVEKSAVVQDTSDSGPSPGAASSRGRPSLVWENVSVDIRTKRILTDITGFVRPGELVALCGSSGAGKTTLLTHLSQTNPIGTMGGRIEFGNKPLGEYFKKLSGIASTSSDFASSAGVMADFN